MAIRVLPYERVHDAEKLTIPFRASLVAGESERHQIVYDLWKLLGIANPNSYLHSESDPPGSDERLYLSLSMLPLDFARRVKTYAERATQRERDMLQIALRFLRAAKDDKRVVINESRVAMLKMYLDALPLFEVLAGGDIMMMGGFLVNHADSRNWEAHISIRARGNPLGYLLYTTIWPKNIIPSDDDLAWLNAHAMELAALPIGDRGDFDRGYCELLLESPATAIVSGAL